MQNIPDKVKFFFDQVVRDKQSSKDDLSIQLAAQSQEEADFDRKLREIKAGQELRKEWFIFILNQSKDIIIFLLAVLIVLRIDIYAFTILQLDTSSESKVRFAIAALTATVSSLLSYLVGRASK